VVAALRAEGHDPQAALAAAERAGVVALDAGRLTFTHPLLRSAVWSTTPQPNAGRRTPRWPPRWPGIRTGRPGTWPKRPSGTTRPGRPAGGARRPGADPARLCRRLRGGRAGRRAAPRPRPAASARAAAAEDALLGGDPNRVRKLAGQVLAGPADGPTRARALLALGTLEHYAGAPTSPGRY
jgi:hypothetical protein